ncbi:protein FAM151A [Anguilla anguilla]|uniref:protein FAM151A n=1 Tax=Anguilla anguilla TaxID=7936 RepID=UPI0015A7ABCC|nr:protein FAM151A [Anguilla anguilla]
MDEEQNKQRDQGEEEEEDEERDSEKIFGVFSRESLTMLGVGIGVLVLLGIITIASVVVTSKADPTEPIQPFPTSGDMLDYLVQNGDIQERDALHVSWYHSANSKSDLDKALKSTAMVLEADVNVQGYNTANETEIPIMAHPPDVYSDNTLQEWLESVLNSKKGIKLDFKSIKAVLPSLEILRKRNQTGINRPVWLNADVLRGPNVPNFWPVVNSTAFLGLIQSEFPDATISPGWKVLYIPSTPSYTRAMVEEMYSLVQHVPQRVSFPVLAVMVKQAWPHFSWLLSQSSRFSLTLWQGEESPSVNDLLFIRDNSNPQRIYYDIYEPVLSQFKATALQKRFRRFYPGGDLVDYFKPANSDGMNIRWDWVSDRASLLSLLKDSTGGMLIIPVGSKKDQPAVPVVENSSPELSLQECLDLVSASPKLHGLYFQVKSQAVLTPTLRLLNQSYAEDLLYRPTWINMNVSHGAFETPGYVSGAEFLDTVDRVFPHVTLAPGWPLEALGEGYTQPLVEDMLQLFRGASQDVSLQLRAVPLGRSYLGRRHLRGAQPRFSLTVQHGPEQGSYNSGYMGLISVRGGDMHRSFYNMPSDYKAKLLMDVYTS